MWGAGEVAGTETKVVKHRACARVAQKCATSFFFLTTDSHPNNCTGETEKFYLVGVYLETSTSGDGLFGKFLEPM